jgi:hypothetical protein
MSGLHSFKTRVKSQAMTRGGIMSQFKAFLPKEGEISCAHLPQNLLVTCAHVLRLEACLVKTRRIVPKLTNVTVKKKMKALAASNPNIVELYVSGHNPPLLSVWAVIREWDHDTEVNVAGTLSRVIAENSKLALDTLIVSAEDKTSILPADAEMIYKK